MAPVVCALNLSIKYYFVWLTLQGKNQLKLIAPSLFSMYLLWLKNPHMNIYGLAAPEFAYIGLPNYQNNKYFKTVALNYFIIKMQDDEFCKGEALTRRWCRHGSENPLAANIKMQKTAMYNKIKNKQLL